MSSVVNPDPLDEASTQITENPGEWGRASWMYRDVLASLTSDILAPCNMAASRSLPYGTEF